MTHTCSYKQQIDDCDFPLTVEWAIAYEAEDDEMRIVDKHLHEVTVWLTDDLGTQARLYDLNVSEREAVTERLAKMLDDDSLRDACWRHFEKYGCDDEMEAA